MIEFRVLGPLQLAAGGQPVELAGERLPRLVAALLSHRNRPVPVERLLEAVFGDAPTPKAAATLRTYLTRLRKRVDDGSLRIDRQPAGYVLWAPDDQVDAVQFERLVARGRRHLERGDASSAVPVLRSALELWRGPAYPELAEVWWARPECSRLDDLRLTAVEHLVDAELACGNSADTVPLLRELLSEDPFREGLALRLMRALYASGRPAEALVVYQDHRHALVDELGIEPGPEMVRLEQQILSRAPDLAPDPDRGQTLRGYRLGARLGSGRLGTVFAARLPGLERDYAVRIYREDVADDPDVVGSFEVDARAAAAVDSPTAVPLYDAWREPGLAALVMRRMPGGTLRDRLQGGALSAADAVAVAERVGGALLDYAARGLAHGDVRPGSVLFDAEGGAFLGDPVLGAAQPRADDAGSYLGLVRACLEGCSGDGWASPPELDLEPGDASVERTVLAVLDRLHVRQREPANPYVGLRPFQEVDAPRFFGRRELVGRMTSMLARRDPRLLLVVGGSGSGKSSAVRAGLLPSLRRATDTRWLITVMHPADQPLLNLVHALRQVATRAVDEEIDGLVADPSALARVAARVAARTTPEGGRLLLVVDQLEELFALNDKDTQTAFLDALATGVTKESCPLTVVSTIRSDFFDRPLDHARFGPLLGDAALPVSAMSPAELEEAITGPAAGRLVVEPGVTSELVTAVVGQPSALPTLQFTLHALAERGGSRLTQEDLRGIGGAGGAIGARAEQLFTSLGERDRQVIRRVLERLVVVGTSGDVTRQRVGRVELVDLATDDRSRVDQLVERWISAHLLTADRRADTREPTVELAHEALVRLWPRLREWVEASRTRQRAVAELVLSAQEWQALGEDPGALLRGARLDQALQYAEAGPVPPVVETYLAASEGQRAQQVQAEAAAEHERARTTRRLRHHRWLLAAALVVAVAGAGLAVERGRTADRNAAAAEARAHAATAGLLAAADDVGQSDWPLSLLLATEARRLDDSPLTRRGLLTALTTPGPVGTTVRRSRAGLQAVAVDASARTAATVDTDGHLEIVDLRSGRVVQGPFDVPTFPFAGGVDTAGGMTAAGGLSVDGVGAVVYRRGLDRPLVRLPTPDGEESKVAFSPDRRLLAVTSHGLVRLLDTRTWTVQQRLRTGNEDPLVSLAWSADGSHVYAGASPRIYGWTVDGDRTGPGGRSRPTSSTALPKSDDPSAMDLAALPGRSGLAVTTFDGATFLLAEDPLRVIEGPLLHDNVTLALAVSSDGHHLAVAGSSSAEAWSIFARPQGRPERQTTVPADALDLAYLPGGDLVTVGESGALTRWDVAPDSPVVRGLPRLGPGFPTFSRDGDLLAMAGYGAGVRLFDAASLRPLAALDIADPERVSISGVSFLPDSSAVFVLACPESDPSMRAYCPAELSAYDTSTGRRLQGPVEVPDIAPWSTTLVSTSSDGRWVATGHVGGAVQVRRTATLALAAEPDEISGGPDVAHVVQVDFAADRPLLTASTGLRTAVWDLDGRKPSPVRAARIGIPAAFTPSGQLMTSTQSGTVQLRDPTSFAVTAEADGLPLSVVRPSFSDDGTLMVTSDDASGAVRLWALPGLEPFGGPLPGPYSAVRPDGRWVVVGGDAAGRLDLDPDAWEKAACATAGRNLTREEWRRYFGGQEYRQTCPDS